MQDHKYGKNPQDVQAARMAIAEGAAWSVVENGEIRPMTESEHAALVEAVRASDPNKS